MQVIASIMFFIVCCETQDVSEEDNDVEHEVYGRQALDTAKEIHRLDEPNLAGCKECTWHDMHYCRARYVMDDHCCCDKKHKERFPFIPHVCYKKLLPLCRPIAADCEEYTRLNICCCQAVLREQWAYYSTFSSSGLLATDYHNILPALFMILLQVIA